MTRRIVLLRHGRTEWNMVDRAQGWADVPLDDVGLAQARACAPSMVAYQASLLWGSDLMRARQTAEVVAEATGLTPVWDERLREYNVGLRSGLTRLEFDERYPAEYAAWVAGHEEPRVEGQETNAEVAERMAAWWHDAREMLPVGQTGIAVTHGAALKTLLCVVLGLPLDPHRSFTGIGNCHWVELIETYEGDRFRLGAYNLSTPDFASAPPVS